VDVPPSGTPALVTVQLALPMTVAEFRAKQDSFVAAIAAAARVTSEDVVVKSVKEVVRSLLICWPLSLIFGLFVLSFLASLCSFFGLFVRSWLVFWPLSLICWPLLLISWPLLLIQASFTHVQASFAEI